MRKPIPYTVDGTSATMNLDLGSIQQIAFTGFNRGLLFAEYGLASETSLKHFIEVHNKSDREDGINYHIVRQPSTEEELKNIKSKHDIWIINCGLREMLETFHAFIDEALWFESTVTKFASRKFNDEEFKIHIKEFKELRERLKFKDKLAEFKKTYAINLSADFCNSLLSLQRIRHCLSHNMGVISKDYFEKSKDGNARITWQTMNAYIVGKESGKRKKLKVGIATKEDSCMEFMIEEHVKKMSFGAYLDFTLDELKDITASLHRATVSLGLAIKNKHENSSEEVSHTPHGT